MLLRGLRRRNGDRLLLRRLHCSNASCHPREVHGSLLRRVLRAIHRSLRRVRHHCRCVDHRIRLWPGSPVSPNLKHRHPESFSGEAGHICYLLIERGGRCVVRFERSHHRPSHHKFSHTMTPTPPAAAPATGDSFDAPYNTEMPLPMLSTYHFASHTSKHSATLIPLGIVRRRQGTHTRRILNTPSRGFGVWSSQNVRFGYV